MDELHTISPSNLLDAVPEPAVVVGPEGRTLRANRLARRHLGTVPESFADVPGFAALIGLARGQGQPVPGRLELGDGRRTSVHLTRIRSSQPTCFLLGLHISHDSAFQVVNEQLAAAHRLAAREQQLRRELEEIREALESFAAVASHDLQAPLRQMALLAEILREDHGDRLPEDGRVVIDHIEGAARRMQALTRSILAYSISTRAEPTRTAVALLSLCEEVRDELQHELDEAAAEVVLDPDLPTVSADRMQLRQLVQNLLSNAIRYRSSERALRVHVLSQARAGHVVVSVEDTGIGFEPEHAERILRPLQRLHGSDRPGSGMGLAICTAIVQRHGWALQAVGVPGVGARFRVRVPREDVL